MILIVILPWIGVFIYPMSNHSGMAEGRMKEKCRQQEFDEHVKQAAGSGGAASEIEKARVPA
jgi:hypothetical protein